jgi:uncharacterized protein
MEFSWDPKKDALNQKNHRGLSFEVAKLVFSDPNFVVRPDRIDAFGEERWHAIGMVGPTLLLVVHVYRELRNGKQTTRIISARKANRLESRKYFEQFAD